AVPAYSRLNPDTLTLRKPPSEKPAPTKTQSAVEITLFAVFGVSLIVAAIGFFALNSPSHRSVPNSVAAGVAAGRVNILLIGMTKVPPPEGDGVAMMTDSMTMLSLRPSTHQLAMIAIPADLWLRLGRFGMHRLGSAQAIGESSGYPGEGPGLAIDTITAATGQPIHGFLRMDDAALQSTIDAVGGIDVPVRSAFFERRAHRLFNSGVAHLNGANAILFTSPYVDGPEGERFAREARQQQVLAAVIEKLSRSAADLRAHAAVVPSTSTMTATNLTHEQIDQLFGALRGDASIRYASLQPFVDPIEVQSFSEHEGLAVKPRNDDFKQIKQLAGGVFTTGAFQQVASR
ncbi:MAG: polyisoprenyl-teichoic acid--peptidoglycan teichoic acid transferase, partial [Thermoanaerobaculia bacterium]|nr:polyisoprenyl-teichoic acid--peptidoglycan teichoic acid transferase [Thermoanaerobaculia bacterium]